MIISGGSYHDNALIKAKITARAAIFTCKPVRPEAQDDRLLFLSAGLHQGADALGAQDLAHLAPILNHSNRLQIRLESSRRRFL